MSNSHDRKESRTHNSRFAKAGVSCFYDSEVLNSSFVHLMKFSAKNPRLRKAANRWQQAKMNLQRQIAVLMIFLLLMTVIGFIYGSIHEHGDINAGGMYTLIFIPIAFIFGLTNLILIMVGLKLIQIRWKFIIIFLLPIICLLILKSWILSLTGNNLDGIYWISLITITIVNLIEFWITHSKSMKIE